MGRAGPPGVDIRETSIRVTFSFEGRQRRETLKVNGQPMLPTAPNIRYAARLVDEIRERIRHGTFRMGDYFSAASGTGDAVTVAAQLETWLGGLRLEGSTVAGYRSAAKFWTAKLGDKPLRAVRYSDLTTALASVPGLSGKTVNNRVSVLREAMAVAVLDKLIDENPVDALKSASYQRPPVDPFSADEADAIIADLFKNAPEQVGNYVEAKFYTGLRTGESFGLRWPNVDLRAKHLVIVDSVVSGEEKASTKTHTSRTVMLNSRSLHAVTAQKAHSYLAGGHVFLDPRDGERWGGEPKFRFYWLGALKRLGIRHRPPYNTRHTYATAMLMAGMKPAFCAGQMGHSVDMFLRTYAKWIPGAGDQAEMALLEQRLSAIPALSLNKG
jgi:integrase